MSARGASWSNDEDQRDEMQYHGYRNFRAKVKYHCNCELALAQLEEHKMMARLTLCLTMMLLQITEGRR